MSKKSSKDIFLLTYHMINEQNDYLSGTLERYFDDLKKAERFIENIRKDKFNFISCRLEKITLISEYYVKKWTKY